MVQGVIGGTLGWHLMWMRGGIRKQLSTAVLKQQVCYRKSVVAA